MAFVASPDGCAVIGETRGNAGPFVIDGCEMSGDVSQIVADMLPYFESGKTAPAFEFLSAVKGPNLANFTVEVGSKISTASKPLRRTTRTMSFWPSSSVSRAGNGPLVHSAVQSGAGREPTPLHAPRRTP